METLLISPARRIEIVFGKFFTILLFSIGTAVLNLLSMCITGQQIAKAFSSKLTVDISPELPQLSSLIWMLILLLLLAALFSALCLALATFARSTREGQYYLTPLLMVVMGMTLFSVSPAVDMTPLYSILPVINVALMLKGLLLNAPQSTSFAVYVIPVLVSSLGYAMLALWWAIDLYNREDVLFRESEKFDLKLWLTQLIRTKDAVPAFPEAVFCFVLILMLHFAAMTWMTPTSAGRMLDGSFSEPLLFSIGGCGLSSCVHGFSAHNKSSGYVPTQTPEDRWAPDGGRIGAGRIPAQLRVQSISCGSARVSGIASACAGSNGPHSVG